MADRGPGVFLEGKNGVAGRDHNFRKPAGSPNFGSMLLLSRWRLVLRPGPGESEIVVVARHVGGKIDRARPTELDRHFHCPWWSLPAPGGLTWWSGRRRGTES